MRFFLRFMGLVFAAGAFVSVVIDGTRSIANSQLDITAIRTVWRELTPSSLDAVQSKFEEIFSPALWINGLEPLLAAPFSVLLIGIASIALYLGRRPRSRIGYRSGARR